MTAVSRLQFLRGRFAGDPERIRPPWTAAAPDFAAACDRCGACVRACPEGILVPDGAGRPQVDFRRGACTFCGACADACGTGAISRSHGVPWHHRVVIGAGCLSQTGVECRVCGEHCAARSIHFQPVGRGRWVLRVDASACTGCGACVAGCPVGAVSMKPTGEEHRACA